MFLMSLSRPFSWDGVGPSVFSRMFFPRRCKNMERLFNSSFVSNIIGISGPGRKNQGESRSISAKRKAGIINEFKGGKE